MVAEAAYQACARIARAHYENFPVASRLLPRAMRPHLAAIYAFARAADDVADEGDVAPAVRLAALDDWRARLHAAARSPDEVAPDDVVCLALACTIRDCRLDVALFDDLLDAFAQDVRVHRYGTWPLVLDYCRRSANPVGRLVLAVAGHRDPALDAASDAVCTALQLTNFWQDLERDWLKGRLYVPADLLRAHGADEGALALRRITPAWRAALADVAARTRRLFDEGRPVADGVAGRLRWELRATWLGGVRILDRLEAGGFDVFTRRPALGRRDALWIAVRAVRWRSSRAGARGLRPGARS